MKPSLKKDGEYIEFKAVSQKGRLKLLTAKKILKAWKKVTYGFMAKMYSIVAKENNGLKQDILEEITTLLQDYKDFFTNLNHYHL